MIDAKYFVIISVASSTMGISLWKFFGIIDKKELFFNSNKSKLLNIHKVF